MLTGLSSLRESTHTNESGKAFNALLKASELIPYDSAIFLSTDDDPMECEQFDKTATVLIKKRIRVSYKNKIENVNIKKLYFFSCILFILPILL